MSKSITVLISDEELFFFNRPSKKLLKALRKIGIRGKARTVYCG
jgi:5-enolpyruvylshikimate-3-phosphate synthase